ncbi:MAG: hypothetical protein ACXWHZ_11040 [Usitatibacter sp.]
MSLDAAAQGVSKEDRTRRLLAGAGTWGALFTVAIVGLSALLRLTTRIDAGEAISSLPATVQDAVRLAHRVSAMGVAFLAALALVAAAGERPMPRRRVVAVAAVVALTVLLAMLGRYTPGYRIAVVTILNVTGGTALACAFWWLREQGAAAPAHAARAILPRLALAVLLAQSAIGSAMAAAAMWGERAFGPLHLGLGALFAGLVAAAAWRHRRHSAIALSIGLLAALVLALGVVLWFAQGDRIWTVAAMHAIIACALALGLVSLAQRAR